MTGRACASPPYNGPLRTVAYCSRMARPFSVPEIDDLAAEWSDINGTFDITGVLFTFDDNFFQVLEGPFVAVGAMFAKIAVDGRHQQVTKLIDGRIQGRAFETWSMRHVHQDDLTAEEQRVVLGALQRNRSPETLVSPTPSARGAALAASLAASPRRPRARETVKRLLYAAETVWAGAAP